MPKALESENTIIALMLLYPSECIPRVVEKLSIDDFVSEKNREIFKVIKELYLNNNKEIIDYAIVINELERKILLKKLVVLIILLKLWKSFIQHLNY